MNHPPQRRLTQSVRPDLAAYEPRLGDSRPPQYSRVADLELEACDRQTGRGKDHPVAAAAGLAGPFFEPEISDQWGRRLGPREQSCLDPTRQRQAPARAIAPRHPQIAVLARLEIKLEQTQTLVRQIEEGRLIV